MTTAWTSGPRSPTRCRPFPLPPLEPESGFRVDRALLYALMRQESGFNTEAEHAGQGAMGLMQLLPSTAHYVAQDGELPSGKEARLYNPGFNTGAGAALRAAT